jgi:hypothetical protein
MSVSNVLAQELIEAGVHFGHRASRWNPKMRPYIHGRRNLIHIIDVRETIRGLLRARKYLKQVALLVFNLLDAVDRLKVNKKNARKPRAKKAKTAIQQTKKLKYIIKK